MAERLPSLRPRELIRVLERAGFSVRHQTGSYVVLYRSGHPKAISVPLHNREMKRGILRGVLRDANISREEFLTLLID